MKSFEEWTVGIAGQEKPKDWKDWEFWEDRGEVSTNSKWPGAFTCRCRSCEEPYPISHYCGADEFDPESDYLMCGGAPWCSP